MYLKLYINGYMQMHKKSFNAFSCKTYDNVFSMNSWQTVCINKFFTTGKFIEIKIGFM